MCSVLGSLLLVLGIVTGYANHVLLDGPNFAAKVDAVRQVPAVSQALGHSLADSYISAQPDLAALRPLLETLATSAVASDALSRPTRAAAGNFQRAATAPHADLLILRVADAGAVLTSLLQRLRLGKSTSPAVSLQLAQIGGQSWSGRTIHAARFLRQATWVLPIGGLALLTLGILLSTRRRQAIVVASLQILGVTAISALVLFSIGTVASRADPSTVRGALVKYGWAEFTNALWWWLAVIALLAIMVTAAASASLPRYDAPAVLARIRSVIVARPANSALELARALVITLTGVAALVDPVRVMKVTGTVLGAALLLYGMAELARATNHETGAQSRTRERPAKADERIPPTAEPAGRRGRLTAGLALAAIMVCTGGYVAVAVGSTRAALFDNGPVAGKGLICNGDAALCRRRFDDVSFAATHNAMSVSTETGWFLGEQGVPILGQLDNGVRGLLIDVWAGYPTAGGRVATARRSYAGAKAQADQEFGPEIVAAGLRVFNTLADPTPAGPEALYLCHGLCELGATDFSTTMTSVRTWLDANPDETLTIVIEAHAPADQIGAAMAASGLASYALTLTPGMTWPTLHTMITSAKRLVVMAEATSGGPAYPWLVNGYATYLQETPYTFGSASTFSCDPNRGPRDAPLFLMNHWLAGFTSLVSDARAVNNLAVLGGRAELCTKQRRRPNLVATNYADIGDLQAVVRRLNNLG